MIAAMKVTGIQPADLELELAPPENGSEKEMRRHEVMERKRYNLVRELQEAAESLDTRDVDALISGPGRVDEHTVFLEEKAKIDKQRERARAELQRKAAWEVESQQAVIRSARDWENTARRIAEQKEEKAKQEQDRLEARRLKVEGNVKAARERQRDERQRIISKLKETNDKVSNNLEALLKERESRRGETQAKVEENQRRLEKHQEMEEEAKYRKHMNNAKRMDELEGWIERRDKDLAKAQMDAKAHFSDRIHIVEEKKAAEAQERQKTASMHWKKLEKARENAALAENAKAENAKEKRTQRLEKWTLNRQAKNKERRTRQQQLQSALNMSAERSAQLVNEYREATIGRYAGVREIFTELVQENKERLDRSDETTREHRIGRITFEKARTESREDQKRQATCYRVEAFRERVAGQTQVEELHHLLNLSLRAQSPRSGGRNSATPTIRNRVDAILTELGVPITEKTEGAGGEETEGGQTSGNGGRGHGEAQGK